MKWSFYGVGMVFFGLIGFAIIFLFIQLTVNSDEEYYLLKEVTEAAMIDSIDYAYFRDTGNLKIVKEKFVESFYKRFASSTNLNADSYEIKMYNIVESPPKVSVEITSQLGEKTLFNSGVDPNGYTQGDYSVINDLDAILEFKR